MINPDVLPLKAEIAELKEKILQLEKRLEKQSKISDAMKERIKCSLQRSDSNYSMFENNILLQNETEKRTRKLQQEKEQAELQNIEKSDFFASMSHELRSPMHAILSFSNFGKSKYRKADREKLKTYFDSIHSSGNRLLRLIDDLLDLAKLESGKFEIDVKNNDICELVEEIIVDNRGLFADKNISVSFNKTGNIERAEFDYDRIMQVVQNLLSNAIKFSPMDGNIRFSCEMSELDGFSAIKFSVIDQGAGIPDTELELVFEKYTQSSKNKNKKEGTGLGLPICKELIGLHHGKIWASNNAEGGGCFSFLLPLKYIEEIVD